MKEASKGASNVIHSLRLPAQHLGSDTVQETVHAGIKPSFLSLDLTSWINGSAAIRAHVFPIT